MATPPDLRAIGNRIEQLLEELRGTADPRTYHRAEELLRSVTELYGAGLARVVDVVRASAPAALAELAGDELVSSLLVVHDLHPTALAARVEGALAGVRPFLAQHGGDVELLDIDADAGAVLIQLLGTCDGCPSSSVTLQHAVERAIFEAAPEIVTIDVDQPRETAVAVPVTLRTKPAFEACPSEVMA